MIKDGTGIFGHVLCRVLSPVSARVSSWRAGAWIWAMPLILVLALASACTPAGERRGTESREGTHPEGPQGVRYEKVAFEALPGWAADDHAAALAAFLKSCPGFEAALADGALVNRTTAGDGRAVCEAARRSPPDNSAAAREVFERYFTPYAVSAHGNGLFTGYFEPLLFGADRPDARFRVPLYRPPDDLAAALAAGQPHYSRSDIDGGALDGRNLELLWVDDPLDAFFLHIQGSGRVAMADGQIVRVGFAGKNGHPYVAIGRELIAKGAMTRDEVSMPAIRKWLETHPTEASRVMALNPSYVYFRIIEDRNGEDSAHDDGPIGAMGVALTPGRSLAVDPAFVPYGAPVWLDTVYSLGDPLAPARPLRRLLVAQDTGTAIKGPVRGDVFWGHGPEAAARAGVMKSPGRWYLLFPNAAPPPS